MKLKKGIPLLFALLVGVLLTYGFANSLVLANTTDAQTTADFPVIADFEGGVSAGWFQYDDGDTTVTAVVSTWDPITFDSNAVTYTLTGFGGADDSTVVEDPTDPTNNVARVVKSATAATWAGTTVSTGPNLSVPALPFTASDTTMTVRVWSPDAGIQVRLKVEDAADPTKSVETEATVTTAAGWETLTFDFANQAPGTAPLNLAYTYNKASIFFNFGVDGATAGEKTYYFDDVTFDGGTPPPPPPPAWDPITFDSNAITYTLTGFGGADDSTVVEDPTDPTNNVARVVKSATAATWAGTTVSTGPNLSVPALPFTASDTTMTVRVWSPDAGIQVRLKVEDAADPTKSVETEATTTVANDWETLTFDFANQAAGTAPLNLAYTYNKASIFFNFGVDGATAGEKTYYFDDVTFDGGTTPPPPPPAWDPITFDSNAITYTLTGFGGAEDSTVVEDPTDPTNNVARVVKSATAATWAGTTVSTGPNLSVPALPFTASDTTMTVRVWSPDAGIQVRLKVEDAADPTKSVETEATVTTAAGWETLTFDFANQAAGTAPLNLAYTYNKASIFFNFGVDGATAGEKTYYFDDVTFSGGTPPPPPPDTWPPITFDSPEVTYTLTGFGGAEDSTVVVDPTDPTNNVARVVKSATAELWAGTTVSTGPNNTVPTLLFTTDDTTMTVRVWSPDAGIQVRLKVEDAADGSKSVETEATTTVAADWETMTFDFANPAAGTPPLNLAYTYNRVSIFFNFGVPGSVAGEKIYYFDDVTFSGGTTPPPPPDTWPPITFDSPEVTYTLTGFGGAEDSTVVVDPTNAANNVARVVKSATAELWAGTTVSTGPNFSVPVLPFTASDTTMTVRVWSPDAGIQVRLKVEDAADPTKSVETEATVTTAAGWETLTFDFTNQAAGTAPLNLAYTYNKVSIFFNFGVPGSVAGEKTYYFDDVTFGGGTTPPPPPGSGISVLVDDFEDGLPSGVDAYGNGIGFVTWGDFWTGTTVAITTTLVTDSDPLAWPGQSGDTHLLQFDANVNGWGGLTHAFENEDVDTWVTQDWTGYEGISFWLYGQNTGNDLLFEIQDNRNPGSTVADTEIFSHAFADDFSGWRLFMLDFDDDFVRKEIGNGAPNDGFGRDEVHGWAFGTLNTGGADVTYYLDNVALIVRTTIIDDFEDGLPTGEDAFGNGIGFVTWGDFWTGTTVAITTTLVDDSDPLALPGQSGDNHLLQFIANVNGWGGLTHAFENEDVDTWITQDWTSYEGIAFWLYGQNTGNDLLFEVQDNRNPGSTVADTEIWSHAFVDNFSGWRLFVLDFDDDFVRKEIGNGAPNDGFGRDEVHGWAFGSLNTGGATVTYYLDNVMVYGNTGSDQPLFVAFTSGQASVAEGGTAVLTVALSRVHSETVTVEYMTAESNARPYQYTPVSGTLTFPAGTLTQTISIDTYHDGKHTRDVRVAVNLYEGDAPLGFQRRAILTIVDIDPADPRLVDDFQGAHPFIYQDGTVDLSITTLMSGDAAAVPGQWAYEDVLTFEFEGEASFGRVFAQGQDWSGYDGLSFWFYGQNSGDSFTFQLRDNMAATTADVDPDEWVLVWSDEFNGPAGERPNPNVWKFEIGDGALNNIVGWGNSEFQYYTDSVENSFMDGAGNLVIRLQEADPDDGLVCWYGPCEYTSARLLTQDRLDFEYGRIEARVLVPDGPGGLWPAFWMLGSNIPEVGWPQSGEIDIMEYVSRLPNEIFGTIHGPGYQGGASYGAIYNFGEPVANEYHTYAVEWMPDHIIWYVDDIQYHEAVPANVAPNEWVFNHPFFMLLNAAIGGNFGGPISGGMTFPQDTLVDYVRVYQAADTAERFEASFTDNFTGWRKINLPFDAFTRSADQPVGAPDDGLTLTEVWGYDLLLPADGGGLYHMDRVYLEETIPPTPTWMIYMPIIRR